VTLAMAQEKLHFVGLPDIEKQCKCTLPPRLQFLSKKIIQRPRRTDNEYQLFSYFCTAPFTRVLTVILTLAHVK